MNTVLSARYAVSNINFSNTNEDLVTKLCRSHSKASTSHLMKFERDNALSFLKQFLAKGANRNKDKDDKVLSNVQLFRLFISYRDTEVKFEFIKGEVFDVIHKVMLLYLDKSQELDKQNLLGDRQEGARNYCFKLKNKTEKSQNMIKHVETLGKEGVTKILETCHNDLLVQMVDQILIECCWFFTNIMITDEKEIIACLKKDIHLSLIKVMRLSQNVSVKLHCFWALRNMSASSVLVVEKLLAEDIYKLTVDQLTIFKDSNVHLINIDCPDYSSGLQSSFENTILKMYEQMIELVRNVASYKVRVDLNIVKTLIPMLKFFTTNCRNTNLLQNCCMVMSILLETLSTDALSSRGDNRSEDSFIERKVVQGENVNVIQLFFDENLVRIPLVLLLHKNMEVIAASLRLIGDILLGSSEQIKKLIQMGVLKNLFELTKSPNVAIRKDACWCLSNCATTFADTLDHMLACQVFLDVETFKKTFLLDVTPETAKMSAFIWMAHLFAKDGNASIRYEIAWFFSNLCQTSGKNGLELAVSARVHILFCRFLETFVEISQKSPVLITDIVESLGNMVKLFSLSDMDVLDIKVTLSFTLSKMMSWKIIPETFEKLIIAQNLVYEKEKLINV